MKVHLLTMFHPGGAPRKQGPGFFEWFNLSVASCVDPRGLEHFRWVHYHRTQVTPEWLQ